MPNVKGPESSTLAEQLGIMPENVCIQEYPGNEGIKCKEITIKLRDFTSIKDLQIKFWEIFLRKIYSKYSDLYSNIDDFVRFQLESLRVEKLNEQDIETKVFATFEEIRTCVYRNGDDFCLNIRGNNIKLTNDVVNVLIDLGIVNQQQLQELTQ